MSGREVFSPVLTKEGNVLELQTTNNARSYFDRQPMPNSIESLERYRDSLNKFLTLHGFKEFRLAELSTAPDGSYVMHAPDQLIAVEIINEARKKEVRHTPQIFKEAILKGIEYQEVPPVQQIAENLFMVTFAMDPGPPLIGEAPKQLLMTILMEEKSLPVSAPVCMIGNYQQMENILQSGRAFESIKMSSQQFDLIKQHYQKVENQYGGKRIPISQNLVANADEQTNVMESPDGISFSAASDKFYTIITFKMNDGSTRTRLVNRCEKNEQTNEIHEASNYVITTNINGEAHVIVAQLNRLNGQAEGFEGIAYELPRGFNVNRIGNSKLSNYVAEREAGITQEMNTHYEQARDLQSDASLEDVHTRLIYVVIPDEMEFNPTGEKSKEDLKDVEQLMPTWMKIKDVVSAIKEGHTFTDSFSIANIGVWLFENEIISLKDFSPSGENTNELAVAMEVVQDWRNGGELLTIWRDDPSNFDNLECPFNRNSGLHRDHHNVGFSENEITVATLTKTQKPWKSISLPEAIEGIKSLRWDNVTIAVLIKMLLQKGLLNEHLEKLSSDSR